MEFAIVSLYLLAKYVKLVQFIVTTIFDYSSLTLSYFSVIGCLASIEFSWLTSKFDCQNGGICINNSGAGFCQCQPGFTGIYCEEC